MSSSGEKSNKKPPLPLSGLGRSYSTLTRFLSNSASSPSASLNTSSGLSNYTSSGLLNRGSSPSSASSSSSYKNYLQLPDAATTYRTSSLKSSSSLSMPFGSMTSSSSPSMRRSKVISTDRYDDVLNSSRHSRHKSDRIDEMVTSDNYRSLTGSNSSSSLGSSNNSSITSRYNTTGTSSSSSSSATSSNRSSQKSKIHLAATSTPPIDRNRSFSKKNKSKYSLAGLFLFLFENENEIKI
jgi:hypothetical protein